jgi:hypothetical protein
MKKKSVIYGLLVCLVIIFLSVPLQSSEVCDEPPAEGPPPDKGGRSCRAPKSFPKIFRNRTINFSLTNCLFLILFFC